MASLLLSPRLPCSLPCYCIRNHVHYKPHILGNIMTKPKAKMRLHNRNVSFMAKKSSEDVAEGSSDEEGDDETTKTKKRAPRRGRRKATIEASEGETQDGQVNTEDGSPEETKKIKRRGRKKAATTASSSEEKDKAKEPKKRGRKKVKAVEELSDNEGEDLGEDLVPSNDIQEHISSNDLESKIAALLLEDDDEIANVMPLLCCFGPAKYSFIPSGRPANRLIDHEIHDGMKDMFWSPDEFVRAPGGSSSNVALALAASGGRVEFMGKLGDDDYGQSILHHLNINGVQTRAIKMDPSAYTAMSLMKVTGRGGMKMSCAKPCAEDCFVQNDINPAVLKEAKMFYYNSSALLEPTTRSSLSKAIEVSKRFGGVIFFDVNLPLPLWLSSKETKSLVKEAWEAANIIEITKQELEFLCGIKPSEEFGTKDNDKSKFTHYSPEVVMKLWHENLKVLFVTNGTSKIHYYTKEHDGWVRGTEDAPITPFTGEMSQSGDAIVAALMKMLAINPHLVTDKDYLHSAIKHAITCGVIDQWLLARERGFLPRETEDPTSEHFEARFVTEKEYRTLPGSIQSEDSTQSDLLYVE
uniref:Carbohydrate kinase PfkB domain-containing protein n=1 Tax=Leersia perrieri TaxID=77586 RepID=A0A0D9VW72_9ORYZ